MRLWDIGVFHSSSVLIVLVIVNNVMNKVWSNNGGRILNIKDLNIADGDTLLQFFTVDYKV